MLESVSLAALTAMETFAESNILLFYFGHRVRQLICDA
jgi:hypothetical protein